MTFQSSLRRAAIWNATILAAGLMAVSIGSTLLAGQQSGIVWLAVLIALVLAGLVWLQVRTMRKTNQKLLQRERLLAFLSQCNQSIVNIGERDALFARVCEVAIEFGKFRMAWIGLADCAAQCVKAAASAGMDEGFLQSSVFSLGDQPRSQSPAATAIRENRSVICNRVQTDPSLATLREEKLKRGYRSAAAFPLHDNGDTVGAFVLYAEEPDFFDADEVKLLEEVAGDLSFALKQLQTEAERRRMEKEAARLGAELQIIFDSVRALIFYKDCAHRIVRLNAAAMRAFGRPAEEIIGKSDVELGLLHAEQYAQDENEILATGQPKLNYVEPFETGSGLRWFQTDKVPLRDATGKISGLIGLAIDITERKRAEDALQASEADFRASFFSSAVGQVQADPGSGRYLRVNPRFCEITGYSEQELLGMTFRKLTHPDDRIRDGVAHSRMVSGEIAELAREKRYRRKDGSTVWVSICASIIRDEAGRALRTLAVVRDITARILSEQAWRAAEAKYRTLVEAALVGIYIIQGDRYVYVNPKMTELFGRSATELTSAPVMDFVVEEDRAMVRENIRRRLEGEVPSIRYRLRMLRKDGSIMHADASGSRAEYDGRPAILGTFLDVTEQKRLEEQLLQSQKMEAIGRLAGGIAHDFNNLLTAIIGNTLLALDDVPPDHPVAEKLTELNKATTRAIDLVQRILTFSRQEKPRRKPLLLRSAIDETIGFLRATFPATIEIRTNFADGLPAVMADATQVHQVVMNLGTNASHAMNGRGVLEISGSTVNVEADDARLLAELRPGRYVRVSISDDGCGMDRSTLTKMFEPFFTTKPQGQGTGLGLSVVHGIMKNHDGTVTAYSEPGRGTVIHLYFPVAAGEVPAQQPQPGPVLRGNGQHILFVDDEELLVRLASEALTRLGYRVTAFSHPNDALAAFRAAPESFEVVVTDLSMPGMTGPELAREILRLRPEIPVVIATGYVRPEDAQSVRDIGIRALMLKPNTVEEMGPLLHELLTDGLHESSPNY